MNRPKASAAAALVSVFSAIFLALPRPSLTQSRSEYRQFTPGLTARPSLGDLRVFHIRRQHFRIDQRERGLDRGSPYAGTWSNRTSTIIAWIRRNAAYT